jgi:hypothetical protein
MWTSLSRAFDTIRRRPLLLLLLLVLLPFAPRQLSVFTLARQPPLGWDSWGYFRAALAVNTGEDMYNTPSAVNFSEEARTWNGRVYGVPRYLYPPPLALALSPFTKGTPLRSVVATWLVVVVATLGFLIYALSPLTGLPIALFGVLLFTPTWHTLWLGQVNALIAGCGAMALVGLLRDEKARPGIWLAVGGLLKITPALGVAALAVRGRWRSVTAAAIVALTAVLLSLPFVPLSGWFEGLTEAVRADFDHSELASLTARTYRLGSPWSGMATWGLTAAVAALTLWRARSVPPVFAVAAALLAPLLVARITWHHHAVMALPVLALLVHRGRWGKWLAVGAWVTVSVFDGPSRAVGHTPYLLATPLALTVCWLACCFPQWLGRGANTPNCRPGGEPLQR